jgi:hypothetical protein
MNYHFYLLEIILKKSYFKLLIFFDLILYFHQPYPSTILGSWIHYWTWFTHLNQIGILFSKKGFLIIEVYFRKPFVCSSFQDIIQNVHTVKPTLLADVFY